MCGPCTTINNSLSPSRLPNASLQGLAPVRAAQQAPPVRLSSRSFFALTTATQWYASLPDPRVRWPRGSRGVRDAGPPVRTVSCQDAVYMPRGPWVARSPVCRERDSRATLRGACIAWSAGHAQSAKQCPFTFTGWPVCAESVRCVTLRSGPRALSRTRP